MKILKELTKKGRILLSFLTIALTVVSFLGLTNLIKAKDDNSPEHYKRIKPSPDGTYELALDVKGRAITEPNNANVSVIFDVSGSMAEPTGNKVDSYTPVYYGGDYGLVDGTYVELESEGWGYGTTYWYDNNGVRTQYTGQRYNKQEVDETRLQAAQTAIKSLTNSLLSNNEDENDKTVEVALITFSTNVKTVVNPTNKYSNIESAVNAADADGGTNWEDALTRARSIDFGDDDDTYVIFVSDGDPTFRNSDMGADEYKGVRDSKGGLGYVNGNYVRLYYYQNDAWHSADGYTGNRQLFYINSRSQAVEYNGTRYNSKYDWDYTDEVYGTGNSDPQGWNYDAAKAIARNIVNPDGNTLYTIGAYGNVERMEDLTNYAYNDESKADEYYYSAADTASLQNALNSILEDIESKGIGKVSISDGTTSAVKASSSTVNLLTVDESSYKYWLSMNVTLEDGKYVNNDLGSKITFTKEGDTYTGTWTDKKGSHTITGTIETDPNDETKEVFKMQWTEANDLHNVTPPAAELVTKEDGSKSVDWDLSSLGTLLNGVTYTVTFDVWPSQYTYDLIADLENDVVKYSDLSSGSGSDYAGLNKYIVQNLDGSYSLKTNTEAVLTYTDTNTENPSEETSKYENPDPVQTNVDKININKTWENDLDTNDGIAIDINVNRDKNGKQTKFYSTTLDFNNHYTKKNINIATGLMRLKVNEDGTGKIQVLEKGHDYTFDELNPDYYKWELFAETIHPMLIEGELKELVLLDEAVTQIHKDGETVDPKYIAPTEMEENDYYTDGTNAYVKLDGKVYLVTDTNPTIKAHNYRRSNLNITKKVESAAADPDEQFEFNITVKDPGLSTGEKIWFSVFEGEDVVTDPSIIISSGWEAEMKDGKPTGFYSAPNETLLKIKLKAGQNLRFTNLTTKASYEIAEEAKENFVFADATGSAKYGSSEKPLDYVKGTNYKVDKDNKKVTGDITMTNSTFTVEIENTYELTSIDVIKTWNDHNDYDKLRGNIQVQVKQNGNNYGDPITITSESVNKDNSNEWDYTITKVTINGEEKTLPRFADDGSEYTYTITEAEIEGYTKSENNKTENGKTTYTVTNTHTPKTNVTATKAWDDANNQDGKRKDVTFKLYKKVNGEDVAVEGAEEKTIAADATGDALTVSWTDLDVFDGNNEIIYTVKEETVLKDYDTPVVTGNKETGFTITNSYTPEITNVTATKVWDDANDQDGKREDVIFKLYKVVNGEDVAVEGEEEKTISETATGGALTVSWTGLPKYEGGSEIMYKVKEETAIDGYSAIPSEIAKNNFVITNSHTPEKTNVSATKVWDDANDQDGKRKDVTFKLYKKVNGKDVAVEGEETKTISEDATGDALTVSWTNLPKYEGGSLIDYTVKEETKIDGYTTDVAGNKETGFTITNSYTPEVTNVTATKAWDDANDQDGKREDVTFKLYKLDSEGKEVAVEGEETKTISETATGDALTVSWTGLPKYEGGSEIMYKVKEETAIDGYEKTETETAENTFLITNKHVPEKTNISATKVWDDANDQDGKREDVTFKLYKKVNGKDVAVEGQETKTIFETATGDDLTVSWTLLPKYEGGSLIDYTVKEETKIDGYTTSVTGNKETGFTITNSYTPETTAVSVKKIWNDGENEDGKRPTSLKVKLSNGNEVTLNSGNDWTATIENLPKYSGGQEIEYKWTEDTDSLPDGYTQTGYSLNKETGLTTITNTYVPGRTNIKITKKWINVSKDGIENIYGHNDSIQVKLSCSSSKADYCTDDKYTYTLNDKNQWTITEENLPKFRDGELLKFSVEEKTTVNNYESSQTTIQNITSSSEDNSFEVEITNTYKPNGVRTISGKKIWEDDNNNDVTRPDSITVNLYDGIHEDPIKTAQVTGEDWTYEFVNLPITDNNNETIKYYVDEVLEGNTYTKEVNDENFEITNYYLPETVTFTVTKHWEDENNVEGLRPESIKVNLLADGEVIASAELNDSNDWTHTFDNDKKGYKKYKNVKGKKTAVKYEIEEIEVKNYETTVEQNEENTKTTVTDVNVTDDLTAPQTNTNNAYDITNKREVEYISISGEKIWNDNNNADRIRPDFINLRLYGNGIYIKTFKVMKEDNWKYILYGLYKYQNGEEVVYTIDEELVEGYTKVIDGYNVINTHEVKEYIEVLPPKTGKEETNNYAFLVILLANILGVSISETIKKIEKASNY